MFVSPQDFNGSVARIPMVLGGDRGHWTVFFEQVNREEGEDERGERGEREEREEREE